MRGFIQSIIERITAPGLVIGCYVGLVAALFLWPWWPDSTLPPHKAADHFAANTRLAETHLIAPKGESYSQRWQLIEARDGLVGKYLAHDLCSGQSIGDADVLPWPDFHGAAVTPVAIDAEPDHRIINQGAIVEIIVGEAHKELKVLATAITGGKWFVMVPRADLGDIAKTAPKLGRVIVLPMPTPGTCGVPVLKPDPPPPPQPKPCCTASPAPTPSPTPTAGATPTSCPAPTPSPTPCPTPAPPPQADCPPPVPPCACPPSIVPPNRCPFPAGGSLCPIVVISGPTACPIPPEPPIACPPAAPPSKHPCKSRSRCGTPARGCRRGRS